VTAVTHPIVTNRLPKEINDLRSTLILSYGIPPLFTSAQKIGKPFFNQVRQADHPAGGSFSAILSTGFGGNAGERPALPILGENGMAIAAGRAEGYRAKGCYAGPIYDLGRTFLDIAGPTNRWRDHEGQLGIDLSR
jgi:hypothetical protein